jgi:hypothetical protein
MMTTPAVIQLFSSYNNDSLTMVLSASFLMSLWSYWRTERRRYWIICVVIGTLAVYTKFSTIYLMISIAILVGYTFFIGILPLRKGLVIIGAAIIPGIILLPWLYFHNYGSTGKFFPNNNDAFIRRVMVIAKMENNGGIVRFLFAPPGISWARWSSPYAIAWGIDGEWEWTKKDLVSSALVTSVLGEHDYSSITKVNRRLTGTFAWLAIGFRLGLVGLLVIRWVPKMRLAGGIILTSYITHAVHLAFVSPYVNVANYRFYAWIGLPLAILLSVAIGQGQFGGGTARKVGEAMLAVGICIHLTFLATVIA